jgi:ABC-type branched-subunit amino acid transport system ATPase component
VIGIPAVAHPTPGAQAALDAGWLMLLLVSPSGLVGLPGRLRAQKWLPPAGGDRQPRPEPTPDAEPKRPAPELVLDSVSVRFGAVVGLDEVTLRVEGGAAVAIVGANGAGKTTLIDAACGAVATVDGRVVLDGKEIGALSVEERARLGLVRSDQDGTLFPTLTALELAQLAVRRPDRARAVLAQVGLTALQDRPLAELSVGTRRLAELASVLALRPRVLLLDEPSAGVAQAEIEPLAALLTRARATAGFTLLLVEHDLSLARRLCDRAVLLDGGRVVADGPVTQVLDRHLVQVSP